MPVNLILMLFLNILWAWGTHGILVGVRHKSGELFLLLYHGGPEGQSQALRVDSDPWIWWVSGRDVLMDGAQDLTYARPVPNH